MGLQQEAERWTVFDISDACCPSKLELMGSVSEAVCPYFKMQTK